MVRKRGRPKRQKLIHQKPKTLIFSPRGRPGRPDEVTIYLDEFEALRLADYENLTQNQAANYMCTSRATFGRIIRQAHAKVAEALICGKIIKIIPLQRTINGFSRTLR